MSLRARIALISVGIVLIIVLWGVFVFKKGQDEIAEVQQQQEAARIERTQLEATLAHLRQLQRDEPRLRAEVARLQDALPSDPRLPDVILQVQEAATLAGIDFMSITPSLPTPFELPSSGTQSAPATPAEGAPSTGQLQAINLTVQTQGKYFEIEDFVVRMERLRRATRINGFALAPGGTVQQAGGSPELGVGFQLQMFLMAPSAAPATSPAVPAATPTPAPGTTPTPTATPAPGTTAVPTATPASTGT